MDGQERDWLLGAVVKNADGAQYGDVTRLL